MGKPDETEDQEAQTDEGQKPAGEAGEDKQATGKQETVPMGRFEEVNTKLKAAEKTTQDLIDNMAVMRANIPAVQAPAQDAFDIYKEVGLDPNDPDDMPTQKQLRAINDYFAGQFNVQLGQLRFFQENPDYPQMVGTTEQIRAGIYAEPLAEAIKANPALLTTIANSRNPQMAAYQIAKLHHQRKEAGKDTKDTKVTTKEAKDVIDEAVENASRVKSSSTAKGGSALSDEGRYAAMSDDEFIKLAREQGANI